MKNCKGQSTVEATLALTVLLGLFAFLSFVAFLMSVKFWLSYQASEAAACLHTTQTIFECRQNFFSKTDLWVNRHHVRLTQMRKQGARAVVAGDWQMNLMKHVMKTEDLRGVECCRVTFKEETRVLY